METKEHTRRRRTLRCSLCGLEITEGEDYWYCNGSSVCGACLPVFARAELAPWVLLAAVLSQLAGMILGSTAAAALVLTLEGKWDRRLLPALGLYGLFLLSWVPITLGCLVKQTTQWEEIRHTRNVSPQPAASRDSLAS